MTYSSEQTDWPRRGTEQSDIKRHSSGEIHTLGTEIIPYIRNFLLRYVKAVPYVSILPGRVLSCGPSTSSKQLACQIHLQYLPSCESGLEVLLHETKGSACLAGTWNITACGPVPQQMADFSRGFVELAHVLAHRPPSLTLPAGFTR